MLVEARLAATTSTMSLRTLLVPAPLQQGAVVVEGDEAHHGRVVLRLRPGDDVRVADGEGRAGAGVVTGVGREALEVEVGTVEALAEPAAALLTVASAVPKGDRFADLVRGLTELGVGRFRPLSCERGERVPANLERSRRIAAEALKQCRRGRRMEIAEPLDVRALVEGGERLVVLDPGGAAPQPGAPKATTLVIGPEGGLSDDELATLGAAPRVRLAATVLRIETAALAGAAVWGAAWEGRRP
jgi:16S rRNA (uracil1498-N3)-methyltransferase